MSLRIFHIIFVMVCVALSIWVGVWGIRGYMLDHNTGALALGIVFFASAAALAYYGMKVYVKLRDLP
jgi:hypothetical protein